MKFSTFAFGLSCSPMYKVLQLLDEVEASVEQLQKRVEDMEEANARLYRLLNVFEKENAQLLESVQVLGQQAKDSDTSNSVAENGVMDKKNMQLKINELVKEIESCIIQLSK